MQAYQVDPLERRCTKCKVVSASSNFSKTAHWCKACQREATRAHRYRVLGTTHEEYLAVLHGQLGACAVCGKNETPVAGGHRGLHLDHDHVTGKRRGVLCSNCNQVLGRVKDSITHLEQLIAYLKAY